MEQTKHPYNFARDGFLYLISYFTLATFTTGLNFLIKALANKVLPDQADVLNMMITPEFVVGLLPVVLVAFPVFLWVSVYTHKLLGKGEMRHDTGVRRWLIYLTMVVVVITILIQLITLLMAYLDGSAGARFLIHTLITLAIAAGILWYEWWQLKFFDGQEGKKIGTRFKIFEWAVFAIVIASIVLGFTLVGSPGARRAQKMDGIRIERISNIRSTIDTYYGQAAIPNVSPAYGNLRLPRDYAELRSDSRIFIEETNLKDPLTGKEFEYKVLSDKTFSLCGEFATELKASDPFRTFVMGKIDDYAHPKGPYCFTFAVSEGKY